MKDSKEHNSYMDGLINDISSLLTGMKTIITVFCQKKTTEQYPEDRRTLKLSERFRDILTMPRSEQNEHHCITCGLYQMAYPNNTIKVTSKTIETEDGKREKILVKYEYGLDSCIFCQLRVNACLYDAITFNQDLEHAVFNHNELVLTLNHPGSHIEEKKKPVTPQVEVAK